ncbi:helix-turn-helix domain-containing protein [Natronorubrum sp. JWXQ-INN-674]|uniref:Helix-turn-helix domain-containing protein n=1 Tax=Natronorubrum halalkaliphilum TaxID=2691917 RepID=A0A6B0VHH3_9EURY|nr:winged helix-turn-helix domain-containing protein [Natronorubrum halalkaliphilum]MXV61008.1 helix-turn-helix domain-containing protein [Natronorubrum halalkaliphilum]
MNVDGISNETQSLPSEELLELLGDRYARRVLQTIHEEPMAAQQIAEAVEIEISKPTVYRRLDQLERAGLVASETLFDAGGNHYRRYRAILESVTLRVGADGLTASVRTDQ